jgi:glycosyltransferase involved in cell wall biosynthesis
MRLVLIGDGDSPHLLKWARALAAQPGVELWAAAGGGNGALLRTLPRLAAWLKRLRPDWLHAHYLTSHGTLAWLAQSMLGVPGRLVGSAWGRDILVTPAKSRVLRWATRRVLAHCALATSDSQVMARRMRELGAGEVLVFPFGLEAMPPEVGPERPAKPPHRFYANRGLEPLYDPGRVIDVFAEIAWHWPDAHLVVANDGSQRGAAEQHVRALRLADRVQFVGRLDAQAQAREYAAAQWYLSLPTSDSVSVSVIEAMAWGCIPLVSDLPANRELVQHGDTGLVLPAAPRPSIAEMNVMVDHAALVERRNREWVQAHGLFAPAVQRFVARLRELSA